GTEASIVSLCSSPATSRRRDAPALLRMAATMVAVSRISLMRSYWNARRILQVILQNQPDSDNVAYVKSLQNRTLQVFAADSPTTLSFCFQRGVCVHFLSGRPATTERPR